jgi:Fur family peroxide stress response transcriptional regulator
MERYTDLLTALKAANLRITPQRMAICKLLATSKKHPTAQMVFIEIRQAYPSLSLATVYNTLDILTSTGAINILGTAGDSTAHYDADTDPHVNLACLQCHQVIDFPSKHIHQVESEVQQSSGFRLLGASVMYYGLCPDCQSKNN